MSSTEILDKLNEFKIEGEELYNSIKPKIKGEEIFNSSNSEETLELYIKGCSNQIRLLECIYKCERLINRINEDSSIKD